MDVRQQTPCSQDSKLSLCSALSAKQFGDLGIGRAPRAPRAIRTSPQVRRLMYNTTAEKPCLCLSVFNEDSHAHHWANSAEAPQSCAPKFVLRVVSNIIAPEARFQYLSGEPPSTLQQTTSMLRKSPNNMINHTCVTTKPPPFIHPVSPFPTHPIPSLQPHCVSTVERCP